MVVAGPNFIGSCDKLGPPLLESQPTIIGYNGEQYPINLGQTADLVAHHCGVLVAAGPNFIGPAVAGPTTIISQTHYY